MESKIKYSDEQLSAIKSEQSSLLVSASAGSGKTKVLIERIADILTNKKALIDEMLVVTFTNLASLEMKSRLKKTLEELAKSDEYFYDQLNLLNTANISTLHKFCQNVIREFFYEVQLDPLFSVLDETEASFLKQKAIEKTLSDYSKSNDDIFEQIYQIFFENRNDDVLRQNIISIYEFLTSKPNDYFDKMLETTYSESVETNPALTYIQKELSIILDYYIDKFEQYSLNALQLGNDAISSVVNTNIVNIQTLKKCAYFDVKPTYSNLKFLSVSVKKLTADERILCDEIASDVAMLKKQLSKIMPCFVESQNSLSGQLQTSKVLLQKFYEIVQHFQKNYSQLKLQKNSLDFNDLEHYCLKILNNNAIRSKLQNRFKYLFIDEYQDINEIQESIIQKLTNDNFVFMVGDVKQSIYMFRQCNPQIFINKMEMLKAQNSKNVINLNANYRSDKDILYFSNLVFENVMTQETACLDYKENSKFIFGETVQKNNNGIASVNLCLINKQDKQKLETQPSCVYSLEEDTPQLDDDSEISKEAKLIFEKIVELKNVNFDYKDMAVLVRTRKAIKQISEQLTKLGVPVNAEYKTNLFDETEIKIIINFLKLIDNYYNDLPLVSVLKSPIVALTDLDLAFIRQKYNNVPFYMSVISYKNNEQDEISEKLTKLFADIDYFSMLKLSKSISQLIVSIIDHFHLEQIYSTQENYLQILTNFELFTTYVGNLGSDNLSQILGYIDDYLSNATQDVNIKTSANSIYIGTVHSSKGLEYPVVFVADTSRKFSQTSLTDKLVKNGDFGIAISNYDAQTRRKQECAIKNIVKWRISEQEKQEEMRMLYVALTRAKSHLFVMGSCKLDDIRPLNKFFQIKQVDNFLDYIVGSLNENTISHIKQGEYNTICHYDNLDFKIETYDKSFEQQISSSKMLPSIVDVDQEYLEKTFKSNNFAFKNTVTALLQEQEDYNISDFKIKKTSSLDDEDFLAIGTNYHKVMEVVDFSANIQNDISLKLDKKLLRPCDLEYVDISKIESAVAIINEIISPNDVVLKEKPFMTFLPLSQSIKEDCSEKVLVQGVVDLIIIKHDEIYLIDYKTSRLGNIDLFKTKYALQLELYKQAIEKFYKKPVTKKYIYSFSLNKLIIV